MFTTTIDRRRSWRHNGGQGATCCATRKQANVPATALALIIHTGRWLPRSVPRIAATAEILALGYDLWPGWRAGCRGFPQARGFLWSQERVRAGQPVSGGVQDTVAQRLGLGFGQVAVEGEELEPGEQDLRHHGCGQPRLVELVVVGGEPADPGLLAGADGILDPGVHAVAGVDVGVLPAPAF